MVISVSTLAHARRSSTRVERSARNGLSVADVSMWRFLLGFIMSLPPDTGPAIDPSTYLHHDRDVRVDFFRGVALLFIFIDHIPRNFLAFFTLTNFAFSDS